MRNAEARRGAVWHGAVRRGVARRGAVALRYLTVHRVVPRRAVQYNSILFLIELQRGQLRKGRSFVRQRRMRRISGPSFRGRASALQAFAWARQFRVLVSMIRCRDVKKQCA